MKLQNIYNKNIYKFALKENTIKNIIRHKCNKKNEIPSEYFIWSNDQIISRARISNRLFVDGTFHHPINFYQI